MSDAPATPTPAGFFVRVFAMIYDTLVMLGIWILTVVVLVSIAGDAVVGAWVQSLLFVELFAFFCYFWLKRGQTVGMMAWRLRLVSDETVTLKTVLLRFIGALLGGACVFVGYVWILFDRNQRSWSDIMSHTYVVREPKPPKRS
ncbi:MAG: RDD family protein [Gammaproteobacteria bacterium]|nr:RDD family protein [Gammaproteobacteria bacterium]